LFVQEVIMGNIVIKAENISKQYRLGEVSTGSLAHDLNVFWHRIRGKENPYLKIGETNDRTIKGKSEYVWALKGVNFEVKHGEVLGIIGRNGAGKSTLLKILSKTTAPSTGQISMKGRVASLLEVGTGFHPDLSGRDNIFLNGAILGMTKKEIKSKFDEIVDFAGVERYIDTPVKRYSSGMYVRLAFGVAAHLESEILIVDEVLAVGDAEFQKKCLGKMKDISSRDGRTVLFVSHNLIALQKICSRGIFLVNGENVGDDEITKLVNKYLELNFKKEASYLGDKIVYNQNKLKLLRVWADARNNDEKFIISESLEVNIQFETFEELNLNLTIIVYTQNEEHLLSSTSIDDLGNLYTLRKGVHNIQCSIPSNFFNTGQYHFSILFVEGYANVLLELDKVLTLDFEENLILRGNFLGNWGGFVRPKWNWKIK
jgi:lipopolysaccharide transport system ATP-binding protein